MNRAGVRLYGKGAVNRCTTSAEAALGLWQSGEVFGRFHDSLARILGIVWLKPFIGGVP